MFRRPVALAAAAFAVTLLAGCGVIPSPQDVVENTIEETIEDATGTDVSTGRLPSDWPGLPTPDGQLLSSLAADGTYVLSYLLDDDTPITGLRDTLVGQGFEVTAETTGEINALVLVGPDWTVSLGWYVTDGKTALNYGVTPTPAS